MADYLRACSPALAVALQGGAQLWFADTFTFTLVDGVTQYFWAAWDSDLTVGAQVFSSSKPWLQRGTWNVSNKMEVPNLKVTIAALNDSFNGGANLKQQIHNGLFDSATFLLTREFMLTPGDTTTLGGIDLFGGLVAGIDVDGLKATLTIKGKISQLAQNAPRNIFQIGCNHAFCDAGCTLVRATYTHSYAVGASGITTAFVPWASAPSNPDRFINGTIAFTSGPNSGSRRNIQFADSTGMSLAYPLNSLPIAADAFTAFEGCDKSYDSGSNQSCTTRSNTQHYRGFEFVPPPNAAY